MDKGAVFCTHVQAHLPDGLQEGLPLHVPHRAADLHDEHIRVCPLRSGLDPIFDLIGDMGDDLHSAPMEIPRPFPVQYPQIDLAGGGVVVLGQGLVDKPLVMAHIQIRFPPIRRHIHFPMLIGIHGAWVHIQVRVQLTDGYPIAPGLEQAAKACRSNALA